MRHIETVRVPLYTTLAVDPAFSDAAKSDKTAITVVGNSEKDCWYVLEAEETTSNKPTHVIQRILLLALRYRPAVISFEVVAGATLYTDLLNPKLSAAGLPQITKFLPGSKRSKHQRILQLEPRMRDGRLFIRRGLTELCTQFHDYPQVDHDDLLDSLSQHIRHSRPARVMDITARQTIEEDFWDEDDRPKKLNGCHIGRRSSRAA